MGALCTLEPVSVVTVTCAAPEVPGAPEPEQGKCRLERGLLQVGGGRTRYCTDSMAN